MSERFFQGMIAASPLLLPSQSRWRIFLPAVLVMTAFVIIVGVWGSAALLMPPPMNIFAPYQMVFPGASDAGVTQYPCTFYEVDPSYTAYGVRKAICVLSPEKGFFRRVFIFTAGGKITGINFYMQNVRLLDLIWQWGPPDRFYMVGGKYEVQWKQQLNITAEIDRRYSMQARVSLISITHDVSTELYSPREAYLCGEKYGTPATKWACNSPPTLDHSKNPQKVDQCYPRASTIVYNRTYPPQFEDDLLVGLYNLPSQPMPFVGRNLELVDLAARLHDPTCRLLTLVGPGGIGKTRLAAEAAERVRDQFAEGGYFVALQPLTSPDSIIPAIIEAIDCQIFTSSNPKGHLLNYLAEKTVLLLLDNFEHLLDAAPLVSELLMESPGLKVLATSRERLNIRDEWVFEVGGLSLPQPDGTAEIGDYSAVQLFVQNARRVQPGFNLAENRAAVAQICNLLDGLPLALELASSWVRALSPAEIVQEIERGLDILETSARDVPARHRNMRAVLDYSWNRLSKAEQDAFSRFSIFRGGFRREAAQAVAGASLPILASLVDKSWLQHDSAGERYDIHELLRQYGREQLEQSGLTEQTLDAHMHYFAAFMRIREGGIKYRRQTESLAEIEGDFENIRLAWKRATACGAYDSLDQMAEALNFFCDMYARFHEGVALFSNAAAGLTGLQSREALLTGIRLRARRARLIMLGSGLPKADLEQLAEALEGDLALARQYQSPQDIAFVLHLLGMAKSIFFEIAVALAYFRDSLDIYTELNDPFYMAEALAWIGGSSKQFLFGSDYYQRALVIQREIDDQNGLSWTLSHLARMSWWAKDDEAGDRLFNESVALQRRRRDLKGLHTSLIMGSQRVLRNGDFDNALVMAEESAVIANDLSLLPIKQVSMVVVGVLHIILELDIEGGQRLCREALALPVPITYTVGEAYLEAAQGLFIAAYIQNDADEMQRQYAQVTQLLPVYGNHSAVEKFSHLAPGAILLLTSMGQAEQAVEMMSLAVNLPPSPENPVLRWIEKLPLIQRLRDDLQERLGDAVYEAAWSRGKRLDLDDTVQALMDLQPFSAATASESTLANGHTLTQRELEVLDLIAIGLSNREIAARLFLALGTVKWYISEVYSKLGVTSRTQAVARAREMQLI